MLTDPLWRKFLITANQYLERIFEFILEIMKFYNESENHKYELLS